MLLSPAGEGAGHKFRVILSHQFAWGFLVVFIDDLTTGPGCGGKTSLEGNNSSSICCVTF